MISKEEYYHLKEYYDHQRLREYNREKVYNEIKEFLEGTDETVIIDQSQENLDKLYSLIMNDK